MNQNELDELLSPDYMMEQIRVVYEFLEDHIRNFPDKSFTTQYIKTKVGLKPLLVVDLLAEHFFMSCVARRFGPDMVEIYGEESLALNPDLRQETRTCILIDMVDGTDLLERDFSNWCSAIVVFSPQERRIEGSFVFLKSEKGRYLYYTKDTRTFKKRFNIAPNSVRSMDETYRWELPIPLKGPAKERTL